MNSLLNVTNFGLLKELNYADLAVNSGYRRGRGPQGSGSRMRRRPSPMLCQVEWWLPARSRCLAWLCPSLSAHSELQNAVENDTSAGYTMDRDNQKPDKKSWKLTLQPMTLLWKTFLDGIQFIFMELFKLGSLESYILCLWDIWNIQWVYIVHMQALYSM